METDVEGWSSTDVSGVFGGMGGDMFQSCFLKLTKRLYVAITGKHCENERDT